MSKTPSIEQFNERSANFLRTLNGRVVATDQNRRSCTMSFDIGQEFCHSGDIIQGGFITAMLDATMSHAAFLDGNVINVASLEIKVSFLEICRAGSYRVEGDVIKSTYRTAFMEGRLYNGDGLLCATSSTVGKLIRPKSDGA